MLNTKANFHRRVDLGDKSGRSVVGDILQVAEVLLVVLTVDQQVLHVEELEAVLELHLVRIVQMGRVLQLEVCNVWLEI